MEKNHVFIRTDANEVIATGHVMRCATIAGQLAALGCAVTFLVSDEISAAFAAEKGFECRVLHTDWQQPDSADELEKMKKVLAESGTRQKLLLDSYRINRHYTGELAEFAQIIVIDDLFEENFAADMVINYTLYHTMFDYKGRYSESGTRLLLGGSFVPLRPEFAAQIRTEADSRVQCAADCHTAQKTYNVLLICGGGDLYNALGNILAAAVQDERNEIYQFQVVAGAYNPHKEELKNYARMYQNVHIHENVTDMAGLMRTCDMAVSAASTVLYECCAMQLPTIFFCVADNQRYDQVCFTKDHVMLYAGDIREDAKKTAGEILRLLSQLEKSPALRQEMRQKMAALVDGKGAARIAEAIMEL